MSRVTEKTSGSKFAESAEWPLAHSHRHSNRCASMPFTSSKALGKLRIVTACGIGVSFLRKSVIRGIPPITALTQISQ